MYPEPVELVFSTLMLGFHQQMAADGAFSINTLGFCKAHSKYYKPSYDIFSIII